MTSRRISQDCAFRIELRQHHIMIVFPVQDNRQTEFGETFGVGLVGFGFY